MLIRDEDVLTTLRILIEFAGVLLSSNVSVSSILIALTILPYNLLSISGVAVACVPAPGGAGIVTTGCVVYPNPPT